MFTSKQSGTTKPDGELWCSCSSQKTEDSVTPSSSGVYAAMGTPLGPVKINLGDKIKDQFIVKKKIGEGACGQVYLVHVLDKNGKPRGRAAMKVEPLMKSKDDEILKMEIFVLKKIQK
ncbi:hypothetical protein ANCCEY_05503 [Ancylostoma ceylanicum]|uniref:Protein kinase domain-containing protein n=1 Tax=Ancylostoma ceylanicum TaxID=53326 RepID=A0A0D6LU79_9BILA|nr:hypothetical protein ANCCEY_05503 [Ancylostoma ceylanicum]